MNYTNLKDFNDALNKYSDDSVQSVAKQVATNLLTELSNRIIEATPVLTGLARFNWQPTLDNPADTSLVDVAGVEETGTPPTPQELQRISQINEQFLNSDSDQLWYSNTLTYIESLDAGSSQKAPANFVESSITAALDALQKTGVNVS